MGFTSQGWFQPHSVCFAFVVYLLWRKSDRVKKTNKFGSPCPQCRRKEPSPRGNTRQITLGRSSESFSTSASMLLLCVFFLVVVFWLVPSLYLYCESLSCTQNKSSTQKKKKACSRPLLSGGVCSRQEQTPKRTKRSERKTRVTIQNSGNLSLQSVLPVLYSKPERQIVGGPNTSWVNKGTRRVYLRVCVCHIQ